MILWAIARLLVPADGRVVFAKNGDVDLNGGVNAQFTYSGFSFTNTGDELRLVNSEGTELDHVLWDSDGTVTNGSGVILGTDALVAGKATVLSGNGNGVW